jgi:hypothetical protein
MYDAKSSVSTFHPSESSLKMLHEANKLQSTSTSVVAELSTFGNDYVHGLYKRGKFWNYLALSPDVNFLSCRNVGFFASACQLGLGGIPDIQVDVLSDCRVLVQLTTIGVLILEIGLLYE